MRFLLLLSLGCAIGCGGAVAGDAFDDASSDGGGTDGRTDSGGVSDVIGPPSDIGFPDAPSKCSVGADPCFAAFLAEVEKAATCMGHPDTCAASGGKDASGCGVRSVSSSGSASCSWPDGAKTYEDKSSGGAVNGKGETCYKYTVTSGASTADVSITFPDGASYVEHITTPGGAASLLIECPDGTRSPSFTSDQAAACGVSVTCCSSRTPPSCKG